MSFKEKIDKEKLKQNIKEWEELQHSDSPEDPTAWFWLSEPLDDIKNCFYYEENGYD